MNHIINNDELPIIIEALIMAKYTCLDTMMLDIQNIESLKMHIIPLNEYMNLISRLSKNVSQENNDSFLIMESECMKQFEKINKMKVLEFMKLVSEKIGTTLIN